MAMEMYVGVTKILGCLHTLLFGAKWMRFKVSMTRTRTVACDAPALYVRDENVLEQRNG